MMITTLILASVGLAISVYGITVERKLQENAQFKAACDINDQISCSRPMLSSYNKLLGISNIWASALYYVAIIILTVLNLDKFVLIIACAGVAVSVVFAYILYFKIRSLCLICTSLYVVNVLIAVTCYFS